MCPSAWVSESTNRWQGAISPEQHSHLASLCRGEPLSLFLELNVLLYAGVLAFVVLAVAAWAARAGLTHPEQSQSGTAGMRLVHSLAQLRQRITDIRESMGLSPQGILQVLIGQGMELFQHMVHSALTDGIELIGRSSHRSKSDLVKA